MDKREIVRGLGTRFIQRKDVKATQSNNGAWYPDRSPFTMDDFRGHLDGTLTLGHYMLDTDNYCKLFAYDLDLSKHDPSCSNRTCKGCESSIDELTLDEEANPQKTGKVFKCIPREKLDPRYEEYASLVVNLRCIADGLARKIHRSLGIPVAIAKSGNKGLHVYGFTGTMPASACKELAIGILEEINAFERIRGDNFWKHKSSYQMIDVEVFPKQINLDGKDLGNLMSLPLGIHRVTGKRKEFISSSATLDRLVPMNSSRVFDGFLPWE